MTDVKDVIDNHVLGRLEASFGKAVAMLILASANTAADVPIMSPTASDFLRLVDHVCNDQRVLDMWGRAGSQAALQHWRGLVNGASV